MGKSILTYIDWIFPVLLWTIIFGKNLFGNFLLLDYVPSTFPDTLKNLYLTNFNYVFNAFDILKFILYPLNLLSIMFTLSILIAMLVSYLYIKRIFKEKPIIFTILFSFIFFFNPFVYTRIMAGQLGVLISYLLIPVFLFYLFQFFNQEMDKKSMIKMILAMTLVSLFSIHFFAINFIIFLVASFYFLFFKQKENKFQKKKYIFSLIIIIIFLVLLNLVWIQGIFSSGIFTTINTSHEDFFSPKMSENIPAVGKIIAMWGFWREGGMILPYISLPIILWYIMLFLLLVTTIIGFLNPNLREKKKSFFYFTLFWTGIILGTGISHPYTKPFFDFLFTYLPLFNGFRDSHKLVSLICLAYAFFIPSFLLFMKEKYKKFYLPLLAIIIIFFLVFTFPLLGLWNQIQPSNYPNSYPNDYFKANDFLNSQTTNGYIIYLPWQTYLTYNWTEKTSSDGRIAVPINQIMNKNILIGSDEWGAETQLGKNISDCLSNQSIPCLESQNIEYIINDKCTHYPDNYTWINNNQTSQVFENTCLVIYKINNKQPIPEQKIPLRFILGVLISIITLIVLIWILSKKSKRLVNE